MIKINNLDKYFFKNKKNEIHVLNDINLELPNKGLIVIHGTSGSGKTTLLNVIGGLDKFKTGEIVFNDETLSKYSVKKWDEIRNESIGYIFQNYYLQPNLSVFDNVGFVLKMIGLKDENEISEKVNYILKALGMYEFRLKKVLQLSGGQQQRVAIARALVKNPNIIIADEPTGNLDSTNTREIMNIIKEISKEKLVLLVTHEKELANLYADRIIEISDGKVVSDEINDSSLYEHNISDETIYLKDLKKLNELETDHLNINYYSSENKDKIKVNLIVKNNTLYLDIDSNIKNVKLVSEYKNIKIKDAKYQKKSIEEATKTSYDVLVLDHSNSNKEKKLVISLKRNLKLALSKVLNFGRKGKLMVASFIFSGIVVSFAFSMLFAGLIVDPDTNHLKDSITIRSSKNLKNDLSYANFKNSIEEDTYTFDLVSMTDEDHQNYVFNFSRASILLKVSNVGNFSISSQNPLIYYKENIKKGLKSGEINNNKNEVLISKGTLDVILNKKASFIGSTGYTGNDFGLWKEEDIYLETFVIKVGNYEEEVKISGITKDETVNIFIEESLYLDILKENNLSSYEEAYNNASAITILSSNKQKLFDNLDGSLELIDNYVKAYDEAKEDNKMILSTTIPIVVIFLGFTLIGFYFVIKSSMISRIKEIGIYRALGIKRIEILLMFVFEILILTTLSTFVGYIIGNLLLNSLTNSLLGVLNIFKINILSFFLGIIIAYIFNLLAGLLPVMMLLRKTPSEILTKYDI